MRTTHGIHYLLTGTKIRSGWTSIDPLCTILKVPFSWTRRGTECLCPIDQSGEQLDRRKRELSSIITATLRTYPKLCYFQGFHDIVQVFLLVLGPTQAIAAVAHLSLLRIRDFMLPSLSPSLAHLRLLPPILKSVDVRLYQHLSQTQPFFALAATLTLYAHEIQEYGDIARLFDFFLAREAAISVYFFAVIVMSRRDELFEIPADEPEMLHSVLSKMPRPLDLENLISRTMEIFTQHPPSSLSWWNWLQISQYSVLKTTRTPMQTQSLEQGAQLFKMQAVQLRRQERRKQALAWAWKHRRPAARTSLGLLIVGFSLYLQRKGLGSPIASNPWRVRETWRCWLR